MAQEKEYFAFISYQRKDEEWADRLRNKLEHYRLPSSVRKQNSSLPKEIRPIFRDALELAGGVLAKEIEIALQQSKYLIVICSPNSAKSPWVNKEIQTFIELGREDHIIPFIIDGTPFSDNPDTECFPPALRSLKGEKELLGININELSRDAAAIKVVARMFGLKFDTLWQRHEREQRRKRWMIFGSMALLAIVALVVAGLFMNLSRTISRQNTSLREATERMLADSILQAQHIKRITDDSLALAQQNNSIQRQYKLIEQQRNDLAIVNNQLNQKNRDLIIANANIYKAMQESEAKRLAARSLTMLENGDSYEARQVAIHALPPFFPYTPEAEHALISAEAQNTTVIHGYSGYGLFYSTNCAEFSPDGKYIATGASHEQVKIWDANNGQELLSLTSDTLIAGYGDSTVERKCHSITFSKDGNYLLAGLSDGTARLWDMNTFIECRRFDSKREGIVNLNYSWNNDGEKATGTPKERKVACETHAALSNDGKLVATASYDGIVKIWNIRTGKLIREIDNIIHAMEDVSFSPNDKQLLLFLRTNRGGDNPITIYDLEKNDTTFTVYGNCAAFSKDGRTLAVGAYTTGDISIYDIKKHEVLYTLQGHKSQINTISFDQTGKYIVSSSNDNTVRLWHIDYSKKVLNRKSNKYEYVWELIKTYEGHQNIVNSASFSYDGRRIVSTSDDNTIRLWDVPLNTKTSKTISHSSCFAIYNSDGKYYLGTKGAKIKEHSFVVDIPVLYDSRTNKPIKEFRGHSNDVLFATFSPNKRNIVTTSRDSTLKIWSIEADSVIQTLKGHQGSIAHADYSKDGKYMVSAGCDKTIKIWDANSGKELYTGIGHEDEVHSVSYNQNGQYIVSSSIDGSVRIWNNHAECQKVLIHNPYISADYACYSPCGKYIAAGFKDGTIRIWDSSNYKELYVIKAHDLWVRYLSFSRDGKKLVSASQDKTVKIWDIATGHELRTILCEDIVKTACLSPDMKECLIAVSSHGIKCVEIPTIEEIIDKVSKRFVKTDLSLLIAENIVEHDAYEATRIAIKNTDFNTKVSPEIESILRKADYAKNTTIKTDSFMTYSAVFSPDGKHILTAGDYAPKIWNAENGELEREFNGHKYWVYGASYSPNGELVLSTGFGKKNCIWNVISGDSIHLLQGHSKIISDACFSPDNRHVLTSSWDSTAIIWDAVNGKKLYKLVGHNNKVNTGIYSPDGTRLLTTSDDKTAILWNAKNGKKLFTLYGHNGKVYEAGFSPDGNIVATVSSDSTMILWDTTTGLIIRRLTGHTDEIKNLTYSPDGKHLATVSKDHTAIVWDAETGEILNKMTSYSVDPIHPQFSPDGKLLAIATVDSMALVWDWNSNLIEPLMGHNGSVMSVSFNPNGQALATTSSNGQVKLWDLRDFYDTKISANWGNIKSISVNPTNNDVLVVENSIINMSCYTNKEYNPILLNPIYSALYTPDGKHLVAATYNGVKTWDTESKGDIQSLSTENAQFVSISPDGRRLLTIEDSIVVLRDSFTGSILHRFKIGGDLHSAIFSPDNSIIAVSADGTIIMFDAKNYHKREQLFLEGHAYAQFSGKANYLASPAKNCIKIWDSSTFSEIACLKDSGYHNSIEFSPNAHYLLDIIYDDDDKSKLQIWDWQNEQIIRTLNYDCQIIASYSPDGETIVVAPLSEKNIYLIDTKDYKITDTIPGTRYNTDGQTSICFSPNGQYIMAVVQENDFRSSSIQTWDCLNKWKTSQYKIPQISFATYSSDGRLIATAEDKNITIRDSYNGDILHILRGHTDNVSTIVFSNNGNYIASASIDGKVIIWDVNNVDSVKTLIKHSSKVNSIAFSPDDKYLATASSDSSVILWNIMNSDIIHSFNHSGVVQSVSFASNGKYVLTASRDKTAVIWDVETGAKIVKLAGHTRSLNSAFFSPDSQYVITASDDNTAIVWDVKSGQPLQSLKNIKNAVFDNTGKRIIGWNNSDVRFIDFPSVEELTKKAKRLFRKENNKHRTSVWSNFSKRKLNT